MKTLNPIAITAVLLVSTLGIISCAQAQSTSMDSLLREAQDNNPQIQEAFSQWKAAEYKIKTVQSLPDPRATYGYFGEEIQTRVGPQEQKFGASQTIPFPGKRELKGKVQAKQARMLQEHYEAVTHNILKEVKFVYYDLYWVDKAIEINQEEKSILEKLENVAQRKYESNIVPQQDVIKTQVELSNIIKKLFLLKQNRNTLTLKMNNLLNRSPDTKIDPTPGIAQQDFTYTLEDIIAQTNNFRQELITANLAVEQAEFSESLARMNYLPDFTIGAEYIDIGAGTTSLANDGEDAWMMKLSVNVPIWFGKLKAQLNEQKETLNAAKKNKEHVENQVSFETQDLYFKIQTYKDIVLLYETALVPQAQQAFNATQTGFETGQVSFLDWLDTERTYLQTRLAYFKAITDYHKSIAFLEQIIGRNLEEVPSEE